jgi:hypothetical protein
MSDSEPLFREEAVEYQARQRGPGELVRLSAAWLDWSYRGFLAGDPLLFVLVPPLKTLVERLGG